MSQLFKIQAVDTTTINAPGADVTLSELQSGTLFICTKAAGANRVINLPRPGTAGLRYRFHMTNAAAVARTLTFTSPVANTMVGYWTQLNGTKTKTNDPTASASIQFTGTAVSADWIEVMSDGTNWNAVGETAVAAGIAFA